MFTVAAAVFAAAVIPLTVVAMISRPDTPRAADNGQVWRWESYGGIEIRVPANWAYGVPGRAWCAAPPVGLSREPRIGAVGRAGATRAVGCPSEYPPLEQREHWLTLSHNAEVGEREISDGWVEEIREVDGVYLTLFSNDPELRAAILDSARPVGAQDGYACTPQHAASTDSKFRPAADNGLTRAHQVTAVSVCRYTIGNTPTTLLSASRMTDKSAQQLIEAILAAPVGQGPNEPQACAPAQAYGDELIVLGVHTGTDRLEIVVRYAGCLGNGIDDGNTYRQLTGDILRFLVTGPYPPTQLAGVVAELIR